MDVALPFDVSESPGVLAWVLLAVLVLVPWMAWRSRAALEQGEELPPPSLLYPLVAAQGLFLMLLALGASWDAGIPLRTPGQTWPRSAVYGAAALGLLLSTVPLAWRLTSQEERARRKAFLPRTSTESSLLLAVSLIAGVGEEIVWRAVFPALLAHWTGSVALAIGLSALSFGLAHWVQGKLAMVIVLGFALVMHVLVALTGGLVAAILVHSLYDALVGTVLGPRLHREVG